MSRGALIAGVSAVLLLIFMWFSWYGVESVSSSVGGVEQEFSFDDLGQFGGLGDVDTSVNAWQAFSFIDLILFVCIVGVLALVIAEVAGAAINLPVAPSAILTGLGVLAFVLILFRLIITPEPDVGGTDVFGVDVDFDVSRKIGLFLGLIASAGMAIGGWLSMQDEGASFRDYGGGGTGAAAPPPPGQAPPAQQPPPPPPAGGSAPPPPPPPPPSSGA